MQDKQRIRELNDQLRTRFRGGKIAITPGVMALGDIPTILNQLRNFSDFGEGNDPHHEHDFGAFKYQGRSEIKGEGPLIYFKFDYFDSSLQFASPNPASAELTSRICTVMLADEL